MAESKVIFLWWVSGAWKTTMMNLLLENPQFQRVCSITTRSPRVGEVHGEQYYFVTEDEFQQLVDEDKFLEYAKVHKLAHYGTRLDWIEDVLDQWYYPVKNIDMLGMEIIEREDKLKGKYICIFLDITDELMRERIEMRWDNMTPEELEKRIESTKHERKIAQNLQYGVIVDASHPIDIVYADILNVIKEL